MLFDFITCYEDNDKIVIWGKKNGNNIRIEDKDFEKRFYVEKKARDNLEKQNIPYKDVEKETILGETKQVLQIEVPQHRDFSSYVSLVEKMHKYRVNLFDADVTPEKKYMYRHRLKPFMKYKKTENGYEHVGTSDEELTSMKISLTLNHRTETIEEIQTDEYTFKGRESEMLERFKHVFLENDPDIILMKRGYKLLPFLQERCAKKGIHIRFHRWNDEKIRYRGGSSFHTYGKTRYSDHPIRLRGRILIDKATMVGEKTTLTSVKELCQITGCKPQASVSRSWGSIFQQALIRNMVEKEVLVPYKQKPIDDPMTMKDLAKADQGGLSLNTKIGFHKDVVEIDFSSMYPWIIHNKNVSAETILKDDDAEDVPPDVPIRISREKKGLISDVIKPLIDRRMNLKERDDEESKERSKALKWVLVTSYGYLRYREFKLGLASSHMTICSYSRDILVQAKKIAENHGFEVVHGIVDSLYLKKKGMTEDEVQHVCDEIGYETGIPITIEGMLDWIVFLPSINDIKKPTPTKHYGVYQDGEIKARGITIRKRTKSHYTKKYQQECLEMMKEKETEEGLKHLLSKLIRKAKMYVEHVREQKKEDLSITQTIGKKEYKKNVPQKTIQDKLAKKSIKKKPGQKITYYHGRRQASLLTEDASVDKDKYEKNILKSLYELYQGLSITKSTIRKRYENYEQTRLTEYRNT